MGRGRAKVRESVWSFRSWLMPTISIASPSAVVKPALLMSSSCVLVVVGSVRSDVYCKWGWN